MFGKLMAELKQRYDYVFIDTPPMANVVDAAVVGRVCDGAVIVIESGSVGYRAVQKTKKQLEKSGTHILGAVLNKVDIKKNIIPTIITGNITKHTRIKEQVVKT